MHKIITLLLFSFCIFANYAMEQGNSKENLQCSTHIAQAQLQRMFYGEKTGCQLSKRNLEDSDSFVIMYYFDDNEKLPISNIFLTNNNRFLAITRKDRMVVFRLSVKSYWAMRHKKKNKGLDFDWGIVKGIDEISLPTVNTSADVITSAKKYLQQLV